MQSCATAGGSALTGSDPCGHVLLLLSLPSPRPPALGLLRPSFLPCPFRLVLRVWMLNRPPSSSPASDTPQTALPHNSSSDAATETTTTSPTDSMAGGKTEPQGGEQRATELMQTRRATGQFHARGLHSAHALSCVCWLRLLLLCLDLRAALLYMLIAILLILFNKATFSVYDFAAPNVLTLSQNVCSLVFLLACKKGRLIEFHDFSLVRTPRMHSDGEPADRRRRTSADTFLVALVRPCTRSCFQRNFRKMLLLGLTFILYMVFGMIAMKVVNMSVCCKARYSTPSERTTRSQLFLPVVLLSYVIVCVCVCVCVCLRRLPCVFLSPMYTTLRRTTVLFVMGLEYLISRKTSSLSIKLSVCLMIGGALIAGVHDLNFDLLAYVIVVVYNVCTALYLVLINHVSTGEKLLPAAHRLDKYDFMFYNNLISIPLLVAIIAATGETEAALASPHWTNVGFLVSLVASSSLAFVLNYAIFWNTAVNSALTQTVSGQAKDVVVVALGFVLFSDAHFDPLNLLGVVVGFAGSIFYAATKIAPWCSVEHALGKLGFTAMMDDTKNREMLPFTQPPNSGENNEERESLLTTPSYAPPRR